MSDRQFDLTRRKALAGLGTIGVAGAGAGLGTSALFSDEESFQNNSIEAGNLDLIVDYVTEYDHSGTNQIDSGEINGDGAAQYSYVLDDVKPGDEGTIVFCPKIVDNPGVLWFGSMAGITNYENGATEPEGDVDTSVSGNLDNGTNDGAPDGELGEKINATVSYSEVPNRTDSDGDGDEDVVCNNPGSLSDSEAEITSGTLNEVVGEIATGIQVDGDPTTPADDDYPSSGGGDDQQGPCLCIEWELPASVGNVIQSDAVEFDFTFIAEQARNNASPENPFPDFVVQDWNDLDDVRNRLDEDIRLLNDLDLNTAAYSAVGADDGTFSPIGGTFTGSFNGGGNTISDLNIDGSSSRAGLFTRIAGTVKNLTLADASVNNPGSTFTGLLAGELTGTIKDVAVTDSDVTGLDGVGGLAGALNSGDIKKTSASGDGTVESTGGADASGGLIGVSFGGTITDSETSVEVKAKGGAGGIAGLAFQNSLTIEGSKATGVIEGTENPEDDTYENGLLIGGLVGAGSSGSLTIRESYSSATITGTEKVGGLVGEGPPDLTVERSYSTADITATQKTDGEQAEIFGGLVASGEQVIINDSYAAITISGSPAEFGGVVGGGNIDDNGLSGSDNYWDTKSTGDAVGAGRLTVPSSFATGLNTSQMQGSSATSSMSGLDFGTEWQTNSGDYPTLQ